MPLVCLFRARRDLTWFHIHGCVCSSGGPFLCAASVLCNNFLAQVMANASVPVPASVLGSAFVDQFYTKLNRDPSELTQLYRLDSVLARHHDEEHESLAEGDQVPDPCSRRSAYVSDFLLICTMEMSFVDVPPINRPLPNCTRHCPRTPSRRVSNPRIVNMYAYMYSNAVEKVGERCSCLQSSKTS